MTSNKPARLSAIHPASDEPAGGVPAGERADQAGEPGGRHGDGGEGTTDLIERLRTSVLALLSGLDREPSSLRVRADQVEIAMEWPVAGAVTAAVPVVPAAAAPEPAAADGEAGDTGHYLTAQMVGVFYRAPEPGARPFVEEGDQVSAGQQVGIIEAMKLMIPVEADAGGRIVRVLAENAEPVEFGAKLFQIEVAES